MDRGKFIVFEGIDGSGKSTQAEMLIGYLNKKNIKCSLTREPTDGKVGKLLRSILSGSEKADPGVVAALFAADRLEHIISIKKKLAEGETVICDRYYFSSFAYQSAELPLEWIISLNQRARELLKPNITVFTDLLPEDALKRIESGRESFEIYENLNRLTDVRKNYLMLIDRFKNEEKIITVNGANSKEKVFKDILSSLSY